MRYQAAPLPDMELYNSYDLQGQGLKEQTQQILSADFQPKLGVPKPVHLRQGFSGQPSPQRDLWLACQPKPHKGRKLVGPEGLEPPT